MAAGFWDELSMQMVLSGIDGTENVDTLLDAEDSGKAESALLNSAVEKLSAAFASFCC